MKTLTIAIPTYNRPSSLLRLLGIIKQEIDHLGAPGLVDVLVRDNSDGNETQGALVSSEFASISWLDYRKNDLNLGFDSNILNLFCEAQGDYIWLVGDDDIIFEGSVQKVLDLLELNPDMLHLPFRQPQDLQVPQYQRSPRIKHWTTMPDAVEQILKYVKITSFVYRGKISVDQKKLRELYGVSGWMHLVLGFETLMNSSQITSITLSDFFAGSLDTEWKSLDWTPAASLLAPLLAQHEIFSKFNLKREIEKFEDGMYLGGIQITLMVTSGAWTSKILAKEYFKFGKNYPFKRSLLTRPFWFLKYAIIRLQWGPYFGGMIKLFQRMK